MEFASPQPLTTNGDQPRRASTAPESDFILSVDEALEQYAAAGIPRTPRSVQRYCALGHLEARRIDTPFGEKWLITPTSVERHIAYIREVTPPTSRELSRQVATGRENFNAEPALDDRTRKAATGNEEHCEGATSGDSRSAEVPRNDGKQQPPPSTDKSRLVATGADADRHMTRLEGENEFLRNQIAVKDVQIKDLTERARETNHLIAGLQRMLSPLLGNSERRSDADIGTGGPSGSL